MAAGREDLYADYLAGDMCRERLYAAVPRQMVRSVINDEIRPGRLERIYRRIDSLLDGRELDLLVGGPPAKPTRSSAVLAIQGAWLRTSETISTRVRGII